MAQIIQLSNGRWRVALTDSERWECYTKAQRRNERWHGRNRRAEWYGVDGLEANYVGVVGEAAMALYLDRDLGEIQVYDGYGDAGDDFTVNGSSIQVKCTRRFRAPELTVGTWEKMSSDYFVLAAYDGRSRNIVDLCGAVAREKLMLQPVVTRYEKPVRVLEEHELARLGSSPAPRVSYEPGAFEELTIEYWLERLEAVR